MNKSAFWGKTLFWSIDVAFVVRVSQKGGLGFFTFGTETFYKSMNILFYEIVQMLAEELDAYLTTLETSNCNFNSKETNRSEIL